MKKLTKVLLSARSVVMASLALLIVGCEGGSGNSGSPDTGTGGSTARMVVVDDYLYAIADTEETFSSGSVQLFDVTVPSAPNPWVRVMQWRVTR